MSDVIVPTKTYVIVWASLLMLLGLTVAVSFIHLGWFNPVAAVTIAFVKAVIIVLYFMHVRYSSPLVWAFAAGSILWLAIMFVLTFSEYLSRSLLPAPTIWLQ
jgi:cytochrome c oxidase subunit IV